jgi:NitT/TauT family transport system ATP-binding protein
VLTLDRVGRRFPNGTVALEDVSLRIEAGEVVALLGPSGCGKSTLLRLVAGLDQPDSGEVRWDGGQRPAPGGIAYVFQDATLMPWASALDNARLPLRLRGRPGHAEARAALARVGLGGFESARPAQLSGGMRMRVSLARALVSRPALMLLDEPFAALDAFTREALQEELRGLLAQAGAAALFVTHSVHEAAYLAGRIVLMTPRPGRILAAIASPLPAEGDRRLDPAYAGLVAEITARLRAAHLA